MNTLNDRELAVYRFLEELLSVIEVREYSILDKPSPWSAKDVDLKTLIYQKHIVRNIDPKAFITAKKSLENALSFMRSPIFLEENKILFDFINTHSPRDLVILSSFEDCYKIVLDRLTEAKDIFMAECVVNGKEIKRLTSTFHLEDLKVMEQVLLGVSPLLIDEGRELTLHIEHMENFKEELENCYNTGIVPAVHGIYTPIYRQFIAMGGHTYSIFI